VRETRVNERIRAHQVRLIDESGENVGVMPPQHALEIARERNLDLVEISPNANPPVCKLMDYGRYKYEQAKKENEARKNQKTITLKEIRLSPRTDEHDVDVKTRKIQQFLADGDRVRVSVKFRGAEMRHPDIGRKLLDGIAEVLKGAAVLERPPIMEGKMMSMIVTRAPGWEPPRKQVSTPAPPRKHHEQQAQPAQEGSETPEAQPAQEEPPEPTAQEPQEMLEKAQPVKPVPARRAAAKRAAVEPAEQELTPALVVESKETAAATQES
jgi:translation initiation factor IF-3